MRISDWSSDVCSSDLPEIPIQDYYYEDVRDDAAGLAERIFAFWGLPLSDESRARMQAWEGRNTQHKLGRFEYTVEESGLDVAAYRESFGHYLDRFFPVPDATEERKSVVKAKRV